MTTKHSVGNGVMAFINTQFYSRHNKSRPLEHFQLKIMEKQLINRSQVSPVSFIK